MLYLGIDQHRKQLTVNLRNEEGDVVLKRQVSTQWDRVQEFFEQLEQEAELEGGFMAIAELCGFNDWLLQMLALYGCRETVLIHTEKRFRKKTDRRDASALSNLLWVNRHRVPDGARVQGLRRIDLPPREEQENRPLTALRKRTAAPRTETINKVQHILLKHNLQQECPTKGIKTKKACKWLGELSLGEIDRLEMNHLLARWELWDLQISDLDKNIEERQGKHKTGALVATIPGASAYSSLALASWNGSIDRFSRPGSLANYWDLTPGCRNSGDATDRLGSITKDGSTIARLILGQWVVHVLRCDLSMKAWYTKIKKRRGSKIARVAVMRRLATMVWHMVKNHKPYRIGGLPKQELPRTA